MGNAASAHNLHNDCVDSELNSYYTQQYLRRTTGETRKNYNQVVLGGLSSNSINVANCKVLPKPSENLKLRATTNGAILQAGGTIRFRANEQSDMEIPINAVLERKNYSAVLYRMRRCNTLILDAQNESTTYRKSAPPLAELHRSQTLLHGGYNKTKSQDNSFANFDYSPHPAKPNMSTTSTLKVNKYNKKRKAPPTPTKLSLETDANHSGHNLSTKMKSTSLAKPRIYATNSNKTPLPQKQQQKTQKSKLQIVNIAPFQRDSNKRTSLNSCIAMQKSYPCYASKLPYRRETSFDAVLLRQREPNDFKDRKTSTQNSHRQMQTELTTSEVFNKTEKKAFQNAFIDNGKKKLTKQHDNITYHSETNYIRDTHKVEEQFRPEESMQFNLNEDTKNRKNDSQPNDQGTTIERRTKYQQSRIPQLKRTFYFGMENRNIPQIYNISQTKKTLCRNEKKVAGEIEEEIAVLNNALGAEEDIVDNGILVHVRPTLPRRQPKTPSFSPAAAWRNLLEAQQRPQQESTRTKPKHNTTNSRVIESPICLTSNPKEPYPSTGANWTPQQDLEDDNDDEDDENEICKPLKLLGNVDIGPEKHTKSNSLHIFSLSLPRDVHLQCQIKSSLDYAEQENSLKAANCWLVPGFNSLQKFKTHLGKNTNSRSVTKCNCASNATTKRNSYHHQNIFGDSIVVNSNSDHQPDCKIYKTSPRPPSYHNGNWLLHKSKSNVTPLTAVSKTADQNCLNYSFNSHSLVNLQPKSLTNICGGKHIVYLPGQNAFNAHKQNSPKNQKQVKTNKSTCKRQCQRQEIVRESLQDLTPIQNIHQSNAGVPEKNSHRFSFQSTVRVLEKRRLAEKLSKDAEIQEAQRLNELEAMKRVEEDFQRKRAPEKANLRNQLRLHLNANTENREYASLPLSINERYNSQHPHYQQRILDVNNNLFSRAEPDGAVSPSLDLKDNLHKTRHTNFLLPPKWLDRYEFDGDESESETQVPDMQRTALLIEPYLHSIT